MVNPPVGAFKSTVPDEAQTTRAEAGSVFGAVEAAFREGRSSCVKRRCPRQFVLPFGAPGLAVTCCLLGAERHPRYSRGRQISTPFSGKLKRKFWSY